jgi:hypothetical protein
LPVLLPSRYCSSREQYRAFSTSIWTAPKRPGPGPRSQTYHSYDIRNPNPNNLVSVMPGSEEVATGINSTHHLRCQHICRNLSQQHPMLSPRLISWLSRRWCCTSLPPSPLPSTACPVGRQHHRRPQRPPPLALLLSPMECQAMVAYLPFQPTPRHPYHHHQCHHHRSTPIYLHHPSIINLCLAAAHINHNHTHPSDTLPTLHVKIPGFPDPHHSAYPPTCSSTLTTHTTITFPFPPSTARKILLVGCPAVRAFSTIKGRRRWTKSGWPTYYLTGAAQLWSVILRRDEPTLRWSCFKALCQQRFRPPLRSNTLGEVARLSFRSTVEDYQD